MRALLSLSWFALVASATWDLRDTNGNLIKDRQQWQTNNGYCGEIPDPCNPRRCVSPPRDTTAAPFCVYSVSCEEVAGRCALAGVGSTDLNRLPQYSVSTAFYSRRKRPVFAHDARSAKRPSRENLDRRAVSVSKLEVERDRFHVCGGVCTEHAGLGFIGVEEGRRCKERSLCVVGRGMALGMAGVVACACIRGPPVPIIIRDRV